ncbi:MAG: hypothetical protein K8F32_07515 [Rhodocyclaceae bacterium]|nr:hypothetical protein [Rhodocyclaceae bacterium]
MTPNALSAPREIVTPYRPIPLEVPEGMKPNEFFNSAENLADLEHNNGLLANPEGLLFYRKAIGHSNLFDGSIIYNTSQRILDPLGRPVRRTQVPESVRRVWNRMNRIAVEFMLERYPDPARHLVLAGEASLDATWPLTAPGVPSIRMLHNHFIVFDKGDLAAAAPADPDNPNLTDGGQHSLFQAHMREAYRAFFAGQHQVARRVGIALEHELDGDAVHAVPDAAHRLRHLGAAHRAAERVEDALRGVVDDRAVEEVGVADRLAVEEQPFRVGQQAVVVHQVGEVLGGVEELVGLHALRHFERNGPVGRDDFARGGERIWCHVENLLNHGEHGDTAKGILILFFAVSPCTPW